jgi:diacylglycerol kinase (ATP)
MENGFQKGLPMRAFRDNIKNIAIVCNTQAGKGKAIATLGRVLKRLADKDIPYATFCDSLPGDFDQFSSVWLVGGDGTLNFFINRFPDIRIPIAIFKGGTGNDFAWKLYGNRSIDEHFDAILNAIPKWTDAGTCNGRYFINGVGIGFDGEVVRAMSRNGFLSGHFAYLFMVLKMVLFYQDKSMKVQTDDRLWNERVFMITAANGSRYGGGFLVAPDAQVNDGKLDIVVIKKIPPLLRFFHLPKMKRGNHLNLSFVETARSRRVVVSSEKIIHGHLDGEMIQSSLFDIEIIPGRFLFLY